MLSLHESGCRSTSSQSAKDENTVMFAAAQAPGFRKAKRLIENRLNRAGEVGGGLSVVEQLEKLSGLREKGHVSDEEFAEQKARILSGQTAKSNQQIEDDDVDDTIPLGTPPNEGPGCGAIAGWGCGISFLLFVALLASC